MAEDDLELTWRRALVHEGRAVVRVRKRSRTRVLEELREARRPTRLGAIVLVPTTQLVGPKRLTRALTRDHPRVRPHLQLAGTRGEQVGFAAHDGADAFALVRSHRHGDVKPVDEADAVRPQVVGAVVEDELG